MNGKNEKCGIVFQIIVIIFLSILFLCSFTYTLAVYFSVGKEAVEVCIYVHILCYYCGRKYLYYHFLFREMLFLVLSLKINVKSLGDPKEHCFMPAPHSFI